MTCVAVKTEDATEGVYCICCGLPARVAEALWLKSVDYKHSAFTIKPPPSPSSFSHTKSKARHALLKGRGTAS